MIVEAMRGTLTGNRDALERQFDTSVSGSAERWSLELVPRDAAPARPGRVGARVSGREADGARGAGACSPTATAR